MYYYRQFTREYNSTPTLQIPEFHALSKVEDRTEFQTVTTTNYYNFILNLIYTCFLKFMDFSISTSNDDAT